MTQSKSAYLSPFEITNNTIFKSVFGPDFTRPPVNTVQPSETRSDEHHYRQVRKEAIQFARPLLGINTSSWIWGWSDAIGGDSFRLPLSSCARMSRVRSPRQEDIQAEVQKLQKSSFFGKLPEWQRRVGQQPFQKLLAEVLSELISFYVRWAYAGKYRADVLDHLRYWVTYVFRLFFLCIKAQLSGQGFPQVSVFEHQNESERWYETALTYLGAIRVEELFAVIAGDDPSGSRVSNIVEDLRAFVTNPATRTYLTDQFIIALVDRALQPGAATIDILRLYISIIKAFRHIDPKGVLLERVARRVRRYLRERDDTVKVIVSGLLSEPTSDGDADVPSEVLVEVADELHRSATPNDEDKHGDLDWDNMNWIPDPVDAAPDYTKSNMTDVIGSLTSLFESKEIFVKELQGVLADRLLVSRGGYEHETRVLDHLKARFGDSALQACEVMLRDVVESSRIDALINGDLQTGKVAAALPRMHAKILSRLFWPAMSEQDFALPDAIRQSQGRYEKAFEHVKQSRQISWVPSLGQVQVELELEDRTVSEEVLPYQAAIIYAFQGLPESQATRTIPDLAAELSMSAALVRSACIFWVSKRVLAEDGHETFSVIEALPDGNDMVTMDSESKQDASAAAAEAAAAQAAKEAEEEERRAKMAIYFQFIISMLTNQGAMPLPRIAMMLNIVVPGGFPFSNEELKEFLAGMVKDGQLEVGPGGNYKAIT
jgi:anaphase-promoting complex subunit 2